MQEISTKDKKNKNNYYCYNQKKEIIKLPGERKKTQKSKNKK